MELPPVLFGESCVFILFYFHDFCQQQTHAPARRACTRHPAKHESKGLTWGLDTAEHRLHCYVDHNNGFAAVVMTLHEAKHRNTTTISQAYALPLPFMGYVKNIPNEVSPIYT